MSRLVELSKEFREDLISKNEYSPVDHYNVGHRNALSDGDNKGKGENGGNEGSAADIQARESLLAKNKFGKGKEYNLANA